MERKEAIKLGLYRYFTGKPCKHGHKAERYTFSGACIECLAAMQKKARQQWTEARQQVKEYAVSGE